MKKRNTYMIEGSVIGSILGGLLGALPFSTMSFGFFGNRFYVDSWWIRSLVGLGVGLIAGLIIGRLIERNK